MSDGVRFEVVVRATYTMFLEVAHLVRRDDGVEVVARTREVGRRVCDGVEIQRAGVEGRIQLREQLVNYDAFEVGEFVDSVTERFEDVEEEAWHDGVYCASCRVKIPRTDDVTARCQLCSKFRVEGVVVEVGDRLRDRRIDVEGEVVDIYPFAVLLKYGYPFVPDAAPRRVATTHLTLPRVST